MKHKGVFKVTILSVIGLFLVQAQSSELEIPNTFEDGQVTSAAEMNANFEAIKAAVNDNNSRIGSPRSQFMGFSSTKLDGAGGIFAMQQACHVSFSDSHVCDTAEVNGSSYSASAMATTGENESAWIRLRMGATNGTSAATSSDGSVQAGRSTTGIVFDATCGGWANTNNAYRGLTINGNTGALSASVCGNELKIACCK